MEILSNKEPVKRVEKIITEFDSNIKIIVLKETARTAKDAAFSLKCKVGAIIKSLLFRVEESFLLCLVPGDKKCSLNKLKFFLNKKDICMATADEVKKYTGFSIGGVSPVGHNRKLDILIDKSFDRYENLFAAAGHPNCVFKINPEKLVQITNGSVKDISK